MCNSEDLKEVLAGLDLEEKRIIFIHMAAYTVDKLFFDLNLEETNNIFNTNLLSCFVLIKQLLPSMINQKWGRIITISSIASENPGRGVSAYASSKMGLVGLTKSLASEYGRFGISSNILSLGYFDAGLINTLDSSRVSQILKDTPRRRLGSGADVIKAIDFILECDFFTGQVLRLNGGLQ